MTEGAYFTIAVILWLLFAVVILKVVEWDAGFTSNNERYLISTAIGALLASVWPLTLPALLIAGVLKFFAERGKK